MDAVIIFEDEFSPSVAGVTVLDRLVVALHRGGCRQVTLCGRRWLPSVKRAEALGIELRREESFPLIHETTLIARGDTLVTAADIRRLIESGGRLLGTDGSLLDVGVVSPDQVNGRCVQYDHLKTLSATGPARRIRGSADADAAGRELWASLQSACDGAVDTCFNRPVGRPLAKLLAGTPVTPNQISVVATLIGLTGGCLMARGAYGSVLAGAVLFQLSTIIDCIDGDLARVAFKESALGKWLDLVGDNVVHIGVFAGLGIGLWRGGAAGPVAGLTVSAVLGVIISLLVIIRSNHMPASVARSRLQGLIERMTNRDFSVLLLALAAVDRTVWFIWMLGIGVHCFWIVALGLQFARSEREER